MNGEGYNIFNTETYHSGLEEGPKKMERKFIQIAMCYDSGSDGICRNALSDDGIVWFWGGTDWHPLPRCPQEEVKI